MQFTLLEQVKTTFDENTSLLEYIEGKPYEQVKAELEAEPLNINVRDTGPLYICKYSQIDSNFSYKIVRQCRGIILEKGSNKVVARAFDKFFNMPEVHADKVDFATASVQEKVDGCCDGDTKIITEDGEKTIKDICENQYKGNILGYDTTNEKNIWTKIIDYSIKNNNNDWYEITTESGEKIILTGDHRVWIAELHCYRKVKDLSVKEKMILVKNV